MTSLLSQVQTALEQGQVTLDMTDTSSGGNFERRLLPTGTALVQFTGYVELGKQPQEFGGKAKAPALEVRFNFHVLGGMGVNREGVREAYVGTDGFRPRITPYDMAISTNEKSNAVKAFKAINYAGDAKHFVEKLSGLYLLPIGVEATKADATKFRNTFDLSKLQAPIKDAMNGDMYQCTDPTAAGYVEPTPDDQYQVLLWNSPTQEQWDSIYIDGVYEAKDGKPAKSKNFIQEKCLSAVDFVGSPLEVMLGGGTIPSLDVSGVEDVSSVPSIPEVPSA